MDSRVGVADAGSVAALVVATAGAEAGGSETVVVVDSRVGVADAGSAAALVVVTAGAEAGRSEAVVVVGARVGVADAGSVAALVVVTAGAQSGGSETVVDSRVGVADAGRVAALVVVTAGARVAVVDAACDRGGHACDRAHCFHCSLACPGCVTIGRTTLSKKSSWSVASSLDIPLDLKRLWTKSNSSK